MTEPTERAALDLDAIERKYIALKYSPWMGTTDVLPLVSEVRRLREELKTEKDWVSYAYTERSEVIERNIDLVIELAELQDSNAALLAACTEETNRADKAEAEVSRLLQLLTPSLASITIGEICGQKQEKT